VHERRVLVPGWLLTDRPPRVPPWAVDQGQREVAHARTVPAGSDSRSAPGRVAGAELGWGDPVGHRRLVEPAAGRVTVPGRPVEPGHVRLEVQHWGAVEKVDTGELDLAATHPENLDQAEPDRVDPARAPGGEHPDLPLLAPQQERHQPQWRR